MIRQNKVLFYIFSTRHLKERREIVWKNWYLATQDTEPVLHRFVNYQGTTNPDIS